MKAIIYTKEKGMIETTYPVSPAISNLTWHRDDGPAAIMFYKDDFIGRKQYWVNGVRHRTDGPAYVEYYENGTIVWEHYCFNDSLHRIDGPAIVRYHEDGQIDCEKYWINGKEITDQVKIWLNQKNITFPLTEKQQYEFMLRFN